MKSQTNHASQLEPSHFWWAVKGLFLHLNERGKKSSILGTTHKIHHGRKKQTILLADNLDFYPEELSQHLGTWMPENRVPPKIALLIGNISFSIIKNQVVFQPNKYSGPQAIGVLFENMIYYDTPKSSGQLTFFSQENTPFDG